MARLHGLGLEIVILTGDTRPTASAMARAVGIERVVADVLPEGKLEEIRRLQAERRSVAMVGDGHQRRAGARAGRCRGSPWARGPTWPWKPADVTLMRGDPRGVPDAIELARRTMRAIRQNLFWAFVYNVIGIPVAAGALYPDPRPPAHPDDGGGRDGGQLGDGG